MEKCHHSTPINAIQKHGPGHTHEHVLSTVALNLVDQSKQQRHWSNIGNIWGNELKFTFTDHEDTNVFTNVTLKCVTAHAQQQWLHGRFKSWLHLLERFPLGSWLCCTNRHVSYVGSLTFCWKPITYCCNSAFLFRSSAIFSSCSTTSLVWGSHCSSGCPPRSSEETWREGSSTCILSITYLGGENITQKLKRSLGVVHTCNRGKPLQLPLVQLKPLAEGSFRSAFCYSSHSLLICVLAVCDIDLASCIPIS